MSDDLENDAEWLAMLAGFKSHFWASRVPAFMQAWQVYQEQATGLPGAELKHSVHGLAGVAALVGLPEIGDSARRIEHRWDEHGGADALVHDWLIELERELVRLDPGQ
jgi:HPt (histidine-containing phosphotransfer) domain-containing protein